MNYSSEKKLDKILNDHDHYISKALLLPMIDAYVLGRDSVLLIYLMNEKHCVVST